MTILTARSGDLDLAYEVIPSPALESGRLPEKDGEIALIFNTTEGWQSHKDSASIRASALMAKVPYFTTASAAKA